MPTAKKQSVLSKINFKSPKTRGIIILLAFALVGGGVMVYRSFAATTATLGSWAANTGQLSCSSSVACNILTDAGKNGLKVVELTPTANGAAKGSVTSPGITLSADSAGRYQVCANAKGDAKLDVLINGNYIADLRFTNTNAYEYKCSNEFGWSVGIFRVGVSKSSANTRVALSTLSIDKVTASQPATPAPTK